jgi:hypothetical protein
MKHHQYPEKAEHSAWGSTNIAQRDQRPDSDPQYELESPSRRQFLAAAAAAMAAGTVGFPSSSRAASAPAVSQQPTTSAASVLTDFNATYNEDFEGFSLTTFDGKVITLNTNPAPAVSPTNSLEQRRARAFEIRQQAAIFQLQRNFPVPQNNGDEASFPPALGNYTKALPHNQLGEVDPNAYQALLQAINSGNPSAFDAVPLGGTARLANPQGAFAFDLEGADAHSLAVEPPGGIASEEFAGETVECYWLALARDIPFSQYGREPVTAAAIQDLRRFPEFQALDAATLFRAEFPGVQTGPYLSQFLLQPYLLGSTPVEQRYRTTVPGVDYLTSYQTWLDIQNGQPASSAAVFDEVPRYLYNGRALGEWAHRNFTYQATLIAALILLGYGNAALDDANPYKGQSTQSGFITFGAPHILDLLGRVANQSLKAAWYQKWAVHRRLRPEETGGRIHNHMSGAARYPLHSKLFDSPALASVFSKYGTFLCPQAYPEGCPTHPAFPGGNATFSAAGVTVLKAFFNESFVIPNPVVPSDDGLSLQPWKGEPLTVGGELNKLALNAAFGRNMAGVHFRRDEVRGIAL